MSLTRATTGQKFKNSLKLKVLDIYTESDIIILSKGEDKRGETEMKEFFRVNEPYRFEWNDLRAFITVINVVLIMIYGLSIAWFGLAIALIGVVKDLTVDRRINGLIMHLANVALNIYFLVVLYMG